ncbi:MAG: hypothetical protein EBV06_17160 [Planctomycetia bacterium]|nr:hypothetical protein [Planctomycetia bacterium]
MHTVVRPDLKLLRTLPTLRHVSEPWGRLELKWETHDMRYWLTTEGPQRKTNGLPLNYVLDYITVEKRNPDGHWDLKAVYSPEGWKLSQGFDYCQMLQRDLEALRARQEEHFTWDRVREIESLERELELSHLAIFELSEQLRLSWT